MAKWVFKLPDIGEGVTEGEIISWAPGVEEGAFIRADQTLCEVMTDKATVTITSPKTGTISSLGGKIGQILQVGAPLVVFELEETQSGSSQHPPPKGPAATAVGDIKEDLPGIQLISSTSPTQTQTNYFSEKPLATPATRKLARDLGVDLRTVRPTGPNNRVTKDDIHKAMQAHDTSRLPTQVQSQTIHPIAAHRQSENILEERIPLRGVRKTIFEQMSRSKHTAAHFTFVEECNVSALKELKDRLKPLAEKQGTKLSFLPFIVKAVVAALKKYPELNSAFDESTQEIVRKYYNIGIATATEAGLMVPVIKQADRRSILTIANEIQRLSDAARNKKITINEMQDSTFTITSLGSQGGLFATPILNFPEVGILGIHQIKQKPVVKNHQIAIGEVMLLSLSFDHRIIDGHVGAAFAYEIISYLETPDILFLEMT